MLTDTPEKQALEHDYAKRNSTKKKSLTDILVKQPKKNASKKRDDNVESDSDEDGQTVCYDDSSDDDMPLSNLITKPVKRTSVDNKGAVDNCVVCGEFGKDGEMWYRCVMCGYWTHRDCSGAVKPDVYICEHCK